MENIWVEVLQSPDRSDIPTPGASGYHWQAMFACQVGVLDHQSWTGLRWGFNAGALFEEALDRQRLFLESQHSFDSNLGLEYPEIRVVAFRYITTSDGILVVLIGKVSAKTREQVEISANEYYHELKSTFPYDYSLSPVVSKKEFDEITGSGLLIGSDDRTDIVQVRRCEMPIPVDRNLPYLQGLWQSSGHAHEQIWRSLGSAQSKILVNITLRPTILYDADLAIYSNLFSEVAKYQPSEISQKTFSLYKEWYENFTTRRLTPWKKYYYLQIHIVSDVDINENFLRSVGTTLTQNSQALNAKPQTLHGYQIIRPPSKRKKDWGIKVYNLNLTSWGGQLANPRLSELADLEEVYSVVRIPYFPPGSEELGFKYMPVKRQEG